MSAGAARYYNTGCSPLSIRSTVESETPAILASASFLSCFRSRTQRTKNATSSGGGVWHSPDTGGGSFATFSKISLKLIGICSLATNLAESSDEKQCQKTFSSMLRAAQPPYRRHPHLQPR